MEEPPLWRRLFDTVNEQVAPRLEEYFRSEQFADQLALLSRLNRQASYLRDELTRRIWRPMNLPTAADVASLRKHLGAIERQLRDIRKALDEAGHGDHDQ